MTFRKVDIIFVALALLVVGGVALLPSPRDRNPEGAGQQRCTRPSSWRRTA